MSMKHVPGHKAEEMEAAADEVDSAAAVVVAAATVAAAADDDTNKPNYVEINIERKQKV